jgi:proline dehydrogenase
MNVGIDPVALAFDNTEVAFAGKNNRELRKAYWLFRVMSSHTVVDVGAHFTRIAFQIGLPVKALVKHTIYRHFCGGETLGEVGPLVERLAQYRVSTILDYGVEAKEGEAEFDQNVEEQLRAIAFANGNPHVPYVSCKITGYADFELLEKWQQGSPLNPEEQQARQRLEARLERLASAAHQSDVALYIDAEESWIQDPVDQLCEQLMARYNREKPVVFNTAQMYRHDRLAYLNGAVERAAGGQYVYGVKLVRGAYMEKERERARRQGYPSPIQPDKAATDRDFNQAVAFCLDHIDRVACCVATHNEQSCMMAAQGALDRGINPGNTHLHFAQLYGMSDHISYNLARAGFNASKYMPYGPVRDVIPYLIRRAEENSSVSGQMGRELGLLKAEMKRRGLLG